METRAFDMNTGIGNTILSITEKIKNAIYSNITIENKIVALERVSYLTRAQKYKSKKHKKIHQQSRTDTKLKITLKLFR